MNLNQQLFPGEVYHIYNKAVGDELLFRIDDDYIYFLRKLKRFIFPVAKIYAYCLMPNHFHLLIRIKETEDNQNAEDDLKMIGINRAFSNFFNSYARSYNNKHRRLGKLFLLPYKRILVDDENYFLTLISYIHRNPIHHGFADSYYSWKYSSYDDFLMDTETIIDKQEVISWFDGIDDFINYHEDYKSAIIPKSYYLEE